MNNQYTVYNDLKEYDDGFNKKMIEHYKYKKLPLIKANKGFVNNLYKRFEEAEKKYEEGEDVDDTRLHK